MTLVTQRKTVGIILDNTAVNKKLMNYLPRNWDMNIRLIKKIKDLKRMTL